MALNEKEEIPIGIPEFYAGRSVFITGFTGYIGKVIVEKLLYSCPDINKIYVLIRTKKGQNPTDRCNQVLQSMVRVKYLRVSTVKSLLKFVIFISCP